MLVLPSIRSAVPLIVFASLTGLLVLATAAGAAPLQGELAASAATDGVGRDGAAGVSAVHTRPSSGSQTVDLLIDLQPRSAGLSFNERTPAGERAMRAGVVPNERGSAAEPRPGEAGASKKTAEAEGLPSGLFGAGATPPVTSQQRMPSDGSHTPVGATRAVGAAPAGPGEGPPSAGRHIEPPAWLAWPREVIVFVRENRDWVIGGIVAILALSGGISVVRGRQRRT